MTRQPVQSSSMKTVGYDADTQTLEIEFTHKSRYRYYGVPVTVHLGLLTARSLGTYFQARIKQGGYRSRKLR